MTAMVKDAFRPVAKVALTTETLGKVTFLPYVRSGIAAALTTPFSRTSSNRPEIRVDAAITDNTGASPISQTMRLRGPGDVLGFDPRQVIRVFPQAGRHDAEPNYLAHLELDRPDLPWLFTPTGPDGQGNLYPWIVLVVVQAGRAEVSPMGVGRPPMLTAPRGELGNLDDSWAWAHAQVLGPKEGATEPSLVARVSESNPTLNLARLVCPRRLDDHTDYRAFVVPAFAVGVEAGLGRTVGVTDLSPAWTNGPPETEIQLPIYYEFRFSTGEDGDFEKLAHRLRARKAPPNLGVRRLDVTHPGSGIDHVAPDAPGALELVEGPVVSPQREPSPPTWAAAEARAQLIKALDRVDDAMKVVETVDPAIGPPLYGGTHLGLTRVDDPQQPPWYETLNLDPRHRVVGGLGTRVVQMDQEELMASAWTQVAGIDSANRDLRLAQLARYIGDRIHTRHLAKLPPSSLLTTTHLAHSRVLATSAVTVRAAVDVSALPTAVSSPAMRRVFRDRGPVARFADSPARAAMVVRPDGMTRDWVRQHLAPDGVARLGDRAIKMGGAAAAALADPLAEVRSWPDMLASGAFEDASIDHERFVAAVAASIVDRLMWTTPAFVQMEAHEELAIVGLGRVHAFRAAANVLNRHLSEVRVSPEHEQRLRLEGSLDETALTITVDALFLLAAEIVRLAEDRWGHSVGEEGEQELAEDLRRYLGNVLETGTDQLIDGLRELAEPFVAPGGPTDIARAPLAVGSFDLVGKLQPAITVTARIRGRLGTLPGWLAPFWFDDLRVEAVMAAPSFPFPMWQALDRYDREWMVPGLGTLDTPDVVTVLVTNSAFVEGFIVGLNHEMGRELLWRGYPTDQRGTYFRSFWTDDDELVDQVHRWRTGDLGSHIDPALSGKVVLLVRGELVRRYPELIAHAQQASAVDAQGIPKLDGPFRRALFRAHLSPNVLLVGFDLTEPEAEVEANQWWFTLAEHPAGPRFGFDEVTTPQPEVTHVNDVHWGLFPGTLPGQFLQPATPPLAFPELTWGDSAASNAAIALQLPARAAFQASAMLGAVKTDGI